MNISILSAVIFVVVFAGVIITHEFGHFIVSRLLKVEVEEFGIGLPPRIATLWQAKGFLLLKNGKRLEIPQDFRMVLGWSTVLNRELKMTLDEVNNQSILRTLEIPMESNPTKASAKDSGLWVDENGHMVERQNPQKQIVLGKKPGMIELTETITEAHPGTEITLNWLPIGGFVKPKGENDPSISGGLAAASPWTRLAVLFAGPTINLLTAVIVFAFLFNQMGIPDYSKVQIGAVVANSPAAQAGIQANDIILSVNGKTVSDPTILHDMIYANLDKPVTMTLQRGSQTVTITATPLSSRPQNEGALGISMGYAMVRSGSVIEATGYGFLAVYDQISALVSLPAEMIRGQVSPDQGRFVGLKGIYDLFGQAVSRDIQSRQSAQATPPSPSSPNSANPVNPQSPTYFTFQLIALLTVSVGFVNLLPFPALDGGRIFFVLLELIIRKRVRPEIENYVHAAGFAILIAFMIYVNAMDFIHPAIINLPK